MDVSWWSPSTTASTSPRCIGCPRRRPCSSPTDCRRGASPRSRGIERVRAFERLHLPLSASLSRATLIKVGELVGASEVIVGNYSLDGDTLKINAHTIRIDVGRLQPDVLEQAPLTGLFPMFDTLAGRLAPETRAPSGPRPPRPPLGAFENYIKGLIAESPAAQATFLETAVRLFAGYDRAELALWEVRTEQGDHAAALAAAKAVKPGSTLTSRARFLSGVSLINLKRYDEAFDLFKALVDIAPVPPLGTALKPGGAAYNNLGVVVIRRGATPQTGTATFYLTKAADADPGDSDYLFNLGYAYSPRAQLPGRRLLAARSGAQRSRRRRRPLCACGCAAGGRQHGRSRSREGAGPAAIVAIRRARKERSGRQATCPARS